MSSLRVEEIVQRLRAAVVRTGFSPQDIFARLDANGDGILNCEEVLALFVQLQGDLCAAEQQAIFQLLDGDGNGQVDINEFCAIFEEHRGDSLRPSGPAEHVIQRLALAITRIGVDPRDLFRKLDANADRYLSIHELGRLIMQFQPEITQGEKQTIFHHFDLDGSGFISMEEFSQTLACAVLDATSANIPASAHQEASVSRVDEIIYRLQSSLSRTGFNASDLFRQLDADHDGFISLLELERLTLQLQPDMTQDEMQLLFQKIDTDRSGVIDRCEFCQIFAVSGHRHHERQSCGIQRGSITHGVHHVAGVCA